MQQSCTTTLLKNYIALSYWPQKFTKSVYLVLMLTLSRQTVEHIYFFNLDTHQNDVFVMLDECRREQNMGHLLSVHFCSKG